MSSRRDGTQGAALNYSAKTLQFFARLGRGLGQQPHTFHVVLASPHELAPYFVEAFQCCHVLCPVMHHMMNVSYFEASHCWWSWFMQRANEVPLYLQLSGATLRKHPSPTSNRAADAQGGPAVRSEEMC